MDPGHVKTLSDRLGLHRLRPIHRRQNTVELLIAMLRQKVTKPAQGSHTIPPLRPQILPPGPAIKVGEALAVNRNLTPTPPGLIGLTRDGPVPCW